MTRIEELSLRTENELRDLLSETYYEMAVAYEQTYFYEQMFDECDELSTYFEELVDALSILGSFGCGGLDDFTDLTTKWHPYLENESITPKDVDNALTLMEELTNLFLKYGEQGDME